jgi:excisionase family DNA binding protein
MAIPTTDEFVSPSEAARLLAVSTKTIYRHIGDGSLRALRCGTAKNAPLRIRLGDLAEQLHLPREQDYR